MTRAFKLADATVAVPIDFTRLPLIAVVGAVCYGEAFDPLILVGAALMSAYARTHADVTVYQESPQLVVYRITPSSDER